MNTIKWAMVFVATLILIMACSKEEVEVISKPDPEPRTYNLSMQDQSFTVNENTATGSIFGQVLVNADTTISQFTIDDANIPFRLNSVGNIVIEDNEILNYEVSDRLEFNVVATDILGQEAEAKITINISDVNEHPEEVFAHYNMDWADSFTNMAGMNNHGTIQSDIASVTDWEGMPDKAVNFHGGSIEISDATDFNHIDTMVIAAWIKIDSMPNWYNTILSKSGNNQSINDYTFGVDNSGRLTFYMTGDNHTTGSLNGYGFVVFHNEILAGQWYHVAVRKLSENYQLFINGEALPTAGPGGGDDRRMKWVAPHLHIGRTHLGNRNFYGDIDEVLILNKELTDQDMARWYEEMTYLN